MSISDEWVRYLRASGYTGSVNDMMRADLQAQTGSSSKHPNTLWMEYLRGEGYSGQLNDMMYQWLGSKGYTGSLNDRWMAALKADDVFGSAAPACTITLTGDIAPLFGGQAMTIEGQTASYTLNGTPTLWVASTQVDAPFLPPETGYRIVEVKTSRTENALPSGGLSGDAYRLLVFRGDNPVILLIDASANETVAGYDEVISPDAVIAMGFNNAGTPIALIDGDEVVLKDIYTSEPFDVAGIFSSGVVLVAVDGSNNTLSGSGSVTFITAGNHFESAYSNTTLRDWCGNAAPAAPAFNPLALEGLLVAFDYSDLTTLFKLSDGTDPVTTDLDPVGRINSVVGSLYADQSTATARVLYRTAPDRVTFDASNDAYIIRLGAPRTGTFFTATTGGVVVGTFTGGADYQIPLNPLYSTGETNQTYKFLYDRVLTAGEVEQVVAWLKENKNAGNDVYTGLWTNRFRFRTDITSLDMSRWNTSGVTGFQAAWANCTGLTSFPLLNTETVASFREAWQNCSGLTTFPLINTALGTNFSSTWLGCSGLTSFPLINTAAGETFLNAWRGCSGLTSFPLINTVAGANFTSAWQGCSGLTSFPLINTVLGDDFTQAWFGCTGLTSFPLINTVAGITFASAWFNCNQLTTFPLINTAAGESFASAWLSCTSLTSFPLINVSSGTDFGNAWRSCTSLATFPANFFDGCAATIFTDAFLNTNLTETSIDGILVSINSNGTSGGTFNQTGGTAPSVATGRPAIDALRARGWTVTVTGGYE